MCAFSTRFRANSQLCAQNLLALHLRRRGGHWGVLNTVIPQKNLQIPQYRKKKNRQIPQYYNTMSKRLDVILKPLHCILSLEQITRKQKLRLGNVRFRQNKQNREHPVAYWPIINKKWNDRKLEKVRKTLEDLKENFLSRPNCQKTASRRFGEYRNTAIQD